MFYLMDAAFSLLGLILKLCHPPLCLLSLAVEFGSALFGLSRSLFGRHCPFICFLCLVLGLMLHPLRLICQVLHFFLKAGVVCIIMFLIRVSRCNLFFILVMKVP